MNFYLQLAVRRAAEAHGASRVHVYSSYFYEKLACGRDGYDYAAVRRWTKTVVRFVCRLHAMLFLVPYSRLVFVW